MHPPIAMLHHKDWIQPKDDIDDNDMNSMPLLFTTYKSYIQSIKCFKEAWNFMSGDAYEGSISKTCNYHDYREHHRFCKAVRADMANLNQKSFNDIISGTLSLITTVFEDVLDAVNIHT
jgi:hypothetical protein